MIIFLMAGPCYARDFRLGLITPPAHIWTEAAQHFGQDLFRQSDEQHRLTVYPSRQLGNEAQMLQLLQTGALDFAILTVSEISNRMPEFGALYTPYLTDDAAGAAKLLRSPVAQQMLTTLPENLGVFGVGYAMAGMRHILSRDPVRSIEDIGGKKLRITPFVPIRDFYNLLGAAPTPMPLSSVFDALANGQIDAIDMDLESIWKLRYYDYADTLVISNHMMFPAVGLMSGKTWLGLDPETRTMVNTLFRQHLEQVLDDYPAQEEDWQQQVTGTELTVITVGPDFFGPALAEWESLWRQKSPQFDELKAQAARIRQHAGIEHRE